MPSKIVVTKDNHLIQNAGYELSLSEQRVILLCIGRINSKEKIPDNYGFTVTANDFDRELGVDKDNAYRDLRAAVNKLYKRTIKLDKDDPDSERRWIYEKAAFKSKGEITLYFSPSILPYLTALKERFTSYKLKDVAQFESSYSFRFYELFSSWKGKDELKVDVAWIRDALQLDDKYSNTGDLKRRVVIPAVNDIQKFSNLNVTFDQVKRGKEITHFVFKYSVKPEIATKTQLTIQEYVIQNPIKTKGKSTEEVKRMMSGEKS